MPAFVSFPEAAESAAEARVCGHSEVPTPHHTTGPPAPVDAAASHEITRSRLGERDRRRFRNAINTNTTGGSAAAAGHLRRLVASDGPTWGTTVPRIFAAESRSAEGFVRTRDSAIDPKLLRSVASLSAKVPTVRNPFHAIRWLCQSVAATADAKKMGCWHISSESPKPNKGRDTPYCKSRERKILVFFSA